MQEKKPKKDQEKSDEEILKELWTEATDPLRDRSHYDVKGYQVKQRIRAALAENIDPKTAPKPHPKLG